MKRLPLRAAILSICLSCHLYSSAQTFNVSDSNALVDLYNSTNGPGWVDHTNWLTSKPVYTWFGVYSQDSVRVNSLSLMYNNLSGVVPASLGNLDTAWGINLSFNRLTGSLPSSLAILTGTMPGNYIDFSHNQLSGTLPDFKSSGRGLSFANISYNNFTFAGLDPFCLPCHAALFLSLISAPQADLPLIQTGNVLSIDAGGPLSHNTYTWYKDGAVVATKTGDPAYTMTGGGIYSVSVNNSNVQWTTLYSIQNTNVQDSLALIDLYNSTSGSNWQYNDNWATPAPVATWYGIRTISGRVSEIMLPGRGIAGPLPPSIGGLQSLTILAISGSQLTGSIPASLGNLVNLRQLDISGGHLSGSIPSSLGGLKALKGLFLSYNRLTGSIPPDLGNLDSVLSIDIQENQLSDTIPSSLGNCSRLQELSLNNNQLTGTIPFTLARPKDLWNMQLHDNHLTGHIPDSICYMPKLARLQLSNNALTGPVPDSLGRDSSLFDIQLQNNNLSGSIKADFSTHYVDTLVVSGNRYNFSVLPIKFKNGFRVRYAPQQAIPLTRVQSILSVSAGGNPANSTFSLFKDGTLVSSQTGDSSFSITGLGNYNIVATNTDAPLLTLYSDTLKLGLVLPDSSISTTQTLSGTGPTDLNTDIFRFVTITPSATVNGLSGPVTAAVTVDNSIQSYNGAPYVRRHYDIAPAVNPTTAGATVTLYYTQNDFDEYNAYVAAHNPALPLLPTNGADNGNVVITQYHGSFTGTSSPGNYSQGFQVISPVVVWDAANGWWTVSFPVTGFSGFFLGTSGTPLPLTLLQFSGMAQIASVDLRWVTSDEKDTRQFIIQRSADGVAYAPIGNVAAKNAGGQNRYGFTDTRPLTGNNFYRLEMQDLDGSSTFSRTVQVSMKALSGDLMAIPNPASSATTVFFNSSGQTPYSILISDVSGRVVSRLAGVSNSGVNKVDVDLHDYPAGVYILTLKDAAAGGRSIRIVKE